MRPSLLCRALQSFCCDGRCCCGLLRALMFHERWPARILHTCFSTIGKAVERWIRYAVHIEQAQPGGGSSLALSRSVQYFSTHNVLRHKASHLLHFLACGGFTQFHRSCVTSKFSTCVLQIVYATCSIYTARRRDTALNAHMTCRLLDLPSQAHYMPQMRLLKRPNVRADEICR